VKDLLQEKPARREPTRAGPKHCSGGISATPIGQLSREVGGRNFSPTGCVLAGPQWRKVCCTRSTHVRAPLTGTMLVPLAKTHAMVIPDMRMHPSATLAPMLHACS
jgi:hypothetical protein